MFQLKSISLLAIQIAYNRSIRCDSSKKKRNENAARSKRTSNSNKKRKKRWPRIWLKREKKRKSK